MKKVITSENQLERLAIKDINSRSRTIWAFTGCAGSGKTILTHNLSLALQQKLGPGVAIRVGMGGYHLVNNLLKERNAIPRKGDLDTFDVYGFLATLRRFFTEPQHELYFPLYDRTSINQAIASAIYVPPSCQLLLVEGLWLMSKEPGWKELSPLFHRTFYVHLDREVRHHRLQQRHLLTDNAQSPELVTDHLRHDALRDQLVEKSLSRVDYPIILTHSTPATPSLLFD